MSGAPRSLSRAAREQKHFDVAELFAFVCPARFATPTPIGLARSLALDQADTDVETLRLVADDLLSRLLLAQHEDGTRMSDRQLRDEAMTLYLAGHETTALTLAWTWFLLSQHRRVEEKLTSEWQHVLAGAIPTADDLSRLPYTAAVIAESMRLFPPVYVIGREATTELELGGYRVNRGYTVMMSQWVNHRDPKYFPDPEKEKKKK